MTYSLTRTRDGAGDSGPMSSAIFYNENGEPERIENSRPFVGAVMIVGTYMAGLFSAQDYLADNACHRDIRRAHRRRGRSLGALQDPK